MEAEYYLSTILLEPDNATPKIKSKTSGKINLNKSNVEGIQPPASGQLFIYDLTLPGFGIRVSPGGSKMYIAQARVRGKVCRYSIGKHGHLTAEQARKEAKQLLGLMAQGIDPGEEKSKSKTRQKNETAEDKAQTVTLAQLLEMYKESKNLRPSTVYLYDGALRRCFSDWAMKPVCEITKDMVEVRHKRLANKNGPRGKGEAHAHQSMRILRSLFNYAHVKFETADGKSLFPENPVDRLSQIKAWHRPVRRQTYISRTDFPAWHKAVMSLSSDTARDFLLFVLFTGLRRSEAASLKWSDINITAKTFTIPAERTKTHQEHKVPICAYLMEMLEARTPDGEYVFPGKDKSKPLAEPKRAVAHVVEQSKVKFMIHDLRRTCTTVAESLDLPHYVLKRLGNWSNATDVTSGYIVRDVERMREPMEKISAYFQAAFVEPDPRAN